MRLVSWNVNGIRACERKGKLSPLLTRSIDCFAFQELKAKQDQMPERLDQVCPHNAVAEAKKAGYSGVGLFSKVPWISVTEGLGDPAFDSEGRTLTAEYHDFFLINTYVPNGQSDLGRVDFKLEYSECLLQHALKLRQKTGKHVLLCGDLNTAHTEKDIARPKQNEKNTGFLPEERAWLDHCFSSGMIDAFREHHPEKIRYSWWSYRANARARNVGWRLDYFLCNPEALPLIKSIVYETGFEGSDHCPVVLSINAR